MQQETASAIQLRDAIRARQISATDCAKSALDRLAIAQPRLKAFLEVLPDLALARAREIDRRLAAHEQVGPLAGVPIAIKDNICLGDHANTDPHAPESWGRTTCASRILENYRSPFTATAAQRLIDAGAVIIAKTNLDEFAMGSSTENSAFGPTRNPWDTDRVPGGSSGGSAAAVAVGVVPAALGSDTGGSIRQPAGWCNLVGFKPSYGRVSRYGLVAYASSLDQIGPLARTVADAALITQTIAGVDPHDATSADEPAPDLMQDLETPVTRLVIGVPRQARSTANHRAVAAAMDRAIAAFRDQGALVLDVDLPHTDHGIAAYYIIATAEASSNLARFDGIRYGRRAALSPGEALEDLYARSRAEGFGHEVQRRIMLGTHVLSSGYYDAYYATALKVRRRIREDFDNVFEGRARSGGSGGPTLQACHAILMPSSPGPAFRIGERSTDPLAMYLEDVYTVGVNLAGLPAVTMPGGFADEGGKRLPVGVQLIGPAMADAQLLRIARMLERAAIAGPPAVPPL